MLNQLYSPRFSSWLSAPLLCCGLLLMLSVSSCQFYRNTTSRFNAYFLAKERFEQVHQTTYQQQRSDFNNVLSVLPSLDSSLANAFKTELDYVIEKASLPIQRHPESDWTDDCYLLIGKARLYQADYNNASNTFKYLNGESEDLNVRHAALIGLMRTFIESNNLDRAALVFDYITKEDAVFSEENIKDFYLTTAHYYRILNNFDKTSAYLELALPYVKNHIRKARYHFILGQIYQLKKQDTKAYQNYQAAIAAHPEYEMVFHAQLNAAQVAGTDALAVKQTQKYFTKLLKDQKNEEYKDRIYYEMANFELKRGNTDQAIELLQKSLAQPSQNQAQKAYTYAKMGEIYYAKSEYEKANAYYDSALMSSTREMRDFEQIEARAKILNEFFEQYDIVRRQDEKIKLSKMSRDELIVYFEKQIEEEKRQIDRQTASRTSRQNSSSTPPPVNPFGNNTSQSAQSWYFANPQAVRQGKNEFARIWRNRPLEDNWRRSNRVSSNFGTNTTNSSSTQEDAQTAQDNPYASVASIEDRLEEVPNTTEEIALINQNLQKALFELGKVYHYQLKEDDNAVATFERFIKDYPQNPNVAEALFILRKICLEKPTCDSKKYERELLSRYPESTFSKIIQNPDYLELSAANDTIVTKLYEQSYLLYQQQAYNQAIAILQTIKADYPENSYHAKVDLLLILAQSKQQPLSEYINNLKDYVRKYEGNQEQYFAQKLLQAAEEEASRRPNPNDMGG